MSKILYIDTSLAGIARVSLMVDYKRFEKESNQQFGSQALLGLIMEILNRHQIKKEDLNEIKVHTGPGSFTGLRVGVSVANALGFVLGIPVNGKKIETELEY